MDGPPDKSPKGYFDTSPYLKLVIDKDGRWFQNGSEIVHPLVYLQFCQMLEKTENGEYRVRLGREVCRVEVMDAPFVIKSVSERAGELFIHLNDKSVEPFNPELFWIGEGNVPYSLIKSGAFHARFLRPAYYQLVQYIESDRQEKEFYITIKGKRWRIPIYSSSLSSDGD